MKLLTLGAVAAFLALVVIYVASWVVAAGASGITELALQELEDRLRKLERTGCKFLLSAPRTLSESQISTVEKTLSKTSCSAADSPYGPWRVDESAVTILGGCLDDAWVVAVDVNATSPWNNSVLLRISNGCRGTTDEVGFRWLGFHWSRNPAADRHLFHFTKFERPDSP